MDPQAKRRVLENLQQLLRVGMWQGGNSYAVAEAIEFMNLELALIPAEPAAEPAPEA